MPLGGSSLFAIYKSVSIFAVTTWFLIRVFNSVCSRLIGDRIIDKLISRISKELKAQYTRFKEIQADLEFTAYLKKGATLSEAQKDLENTLESVETLSKHEAELVWFNWENKTKARGKIRFQDQNSFEISYDLIRDSESLTEDEPELSSIGITIQFDFEFHNIKGALLDLGKLIEFIQNGMESTFDVDRFTRNQIILSPLTENLTLDDWIEEEDLEANFLLSDEMNERTVEFFDDRAIITSPSSGLDNKTAEYIRLILLNYYL